MYYQMANAKRSIYPLQNIHRINLKYMMNSSLITFPEKDQKFKISLSMILDEEESFLLMDGEND